MIIWGKDHEKRAVALAKAYGEGAMDLATLKQESEELSAVSCADATLTVWGHGNAATFCKMSNAEFGQFIKNWKELNPGLKCVEIVTCDARHNDDPFAGYAASVTRFVHESYKDIVIKALPLGQHRNDCSILWANATTATFCYITAPSKATLLHANQRLKELDSGHDGDLNKVAQEMAKERSHAPNDFSVNAGYFKHLRHCLVAIK